MPRGETTVSGTLSLYEAERAVRRTIIMLIRAFDDEDWSIVSECLSAACGGSAVVHGGRAESIQGSDSMLNVMKQIAAQRRLDGIKCMHIVSELSVTVTGDAATGSSYQTAYLYRTGEVTSPTSKSGSLGTYGLRLEGNEWRVVSLQVARLWLEGESY